MRLPIKPDSRPFFKKLISLIQKATGFAMKESHKQMARGLFKSIKKVPQLKDLGGDTLYSKNLLDSSGGGKKKANKGMSSMP